MAKDVKRSSNSELVIGPSRSTSLIDKYHIDNIIKDKDRRSKFQNRHKANLAENIRSKLMDGETNKKTFADRENQKSQHDNPYYRIRKRDLLEDLLKGGFSKDDVDRIIKITEKTHHSYNLPIKAPLLWIDREEEITAPDFIIKHYLLGRGLITGDIKRLDPALYEALRAHTKSGKPLPEGFDLPSKKEAIDREQTDPSDVEAQGLEARRHADRLRKRQQRERERSQERD